MSENKNQILKLDKINLKSALNTMEKAFINDPFYMYLIKYREKREQFLKKFFEFRLSYGLNYGEVFITSQNMEGVAVWFFEDEVYMTRKKSMKSGFLKFLLSTNPLILSELMKLEEYSESMEKKHAPFKHCKLSPIAVNPSYQKKGFGKKLMENMMVKLDELNMPCYLQTQSEYNVALYQKYGFKIVEEKRIPGTYILDYVMLRKE